MNLSGQIDAQLLALLACPRDHAPLQSVGDALHCAHGHRYPVIDGIPIFLLPETEQTIGIAAASLRAVQGGGPLFIETIGVSEDERRGILRDWRADAPVDAVISYLVGATSGYGYLEQIGRLDRYPIPDIPIRRGTGGLLLDIGCNWGRWSVAAARKGWLPVGIDPSLGALTASRRAFRGREPPIHYVCGDARYLPFKADIFDSAFSYSVLQHFSETDAERAFAEIGRVLKANAFAKIQMAHAGGLRSRQVRRRNASSEPFRVRYWTLERLHAAAARRIGKPRIYAEAYGGLGLLAEDWDLVSAPAKVLIAASIFLKATSAAIPSLIRLADSVYIEVEKE